MMLRDDYHYLNMIKQFNVKFWFQFSISLKYAVNLCTPRTVYGGYSRQRGAGVFGSFNHYLAPVGRQSLSGAKKLANNKTVLKIARKASEIGAKVLTELFATSANHLRNAVATPC